MGRPFSELDTSSLTKALMVMKAFINQVELVQSTNMPIVVCRGSINKYEVNPVNNMKVCPPSYDYEGATRANTQISCCTEAPKCDSTVPPSDGNERALVNQRLKKPHHSSAAANPPKCNVSEMGMFFLHKPDMKASFRQNSAGFGRKLAKSHRQERNVKVQSTRIHYNTILDIPVHSVWYLSTRFLQVDNARNYST